MGRKVWSTQWRISVKAEGVAGFLSDGEQKEGLPEKAKEGMRKEEEKRV